MSYTVLEEFVILRDGAAVHYSQVGSKVELSDDEAAELLAEGKVCRPGEEPVAEVAAPEPEVIRSPYTVIEEFIILRDGAAVHYSQVGSTALLSDDEAVEPLAAGQIVAPVEPEAEEVPDPALAEWLTAETQYHADVAEWLEAEKHHAKKPNRER